MYRQLRRICAQYSQNLEGPLLIVVGALHGNEPAGLQAILTMQKMLEVEPITNPSFQFKGNFVGLVGNKQALRAQTRMIEHDLNRIWTAEQIARVCANKDSLKNESLELKQLYLKIHKTIRASQADDVFILDLHTTTAKGGIFSLPFNTNDSLRIAEDIHAPIIMDIHKSLNGTMGGYFQFHAQALYPDKNVQCMVFEGGQHEDPVSVNRCVAALAATMKSIGCVEDKHIEHAHDKILLQYSKGLPEKLKILYKHSIQSGDQFQMIPGFLNFQAIERGQLLATDQNGEIRAKNSGRILMPLYQTQGDDGFFVAEVV